MLQVQPARDALEAQRGAEPEPEALEQRGDIRAIPAQCLPALITGPAQEVARNWLAGRLTGDLREYAEPLAEAAWRSVRADRIRTNDGG